MSPSVMGEQVVSALVLVTGLVSAGVGVVMTTSRLRVAQRAHRRTEAIYAGLPEGWNSWFVGGFSDLTLASRSFVALAAGSAWALAGLAMVGLGIRLFLRG